ncbi:MAG: hypothetical protein LC789_08705 [Actinobacteria bacterium]|nr:hypothetical protein [Actinomycetota bacterium]MCA1722019.1 hypothetical protein [Actinomycetota bacterium]
MTRRRILLGAALLGVLAGTAAPALAEDGRTTVCLVTTNDRNNPGAEPVCVWVPVEKSQP